MNKYNWDFTLLDTGFFRSGQAFHAGEVHSRITSCFPPPMSTLQGAIRSAIATNRGWRPGNESDWPKELGDASSLGQLSLLGPYLIWEGKPLFPAPFNFLIKRMPGNDSGARSEVKVSHLIPGDDYPCDLGTPVPLLQKKKKLEGARIPENVYLTPLGYQAVSAGKEPPQEEVHFHDCLWSIEERVGLKRSAITRTAKDHYLYRLGHIRPERYLKIRVIVCGLPPEWPQPKQQIVPLGGEGRQAAVEIQPVTSTGSNSIFPSVPKLSPRAGQIQYTVSLITPFSPGDREGSEKLIQLIKKGPANAPGECVSACTGKPCYLGGWDLEKQIPRPQKAFLPPGCTWYFKADAAKKGMIENLHGGFIENGEDSCYGYGQILIGTWEVDEI